MRNLLNMVMVFLIGCSCLLLPARADESGDSQISDYRARIAFLYSFLKFVEWPGDNSPRKTGKAVICIRGDRDFSAYLAALPDRKESALKLEVRELSSGDTGVSTCHILFIGSGAEDNIAGILALVKNYPVLTVSKADDFADNGGIMEIMKAGRKVGLFSQSKVNLRINIKVSEAVNLRVDARLLQIADEVIK